MAITGPVDVSEFMQTQARANAALNLLSILSHKEMPGEGYQAGLELTRQERSAANAALGFMEEFLSTKKPNKQNGVLPTFN